MKEKILSLFLFIIPILGILDAGYITYSEFSGKLPPCKPPFACGVVLQSEWAYIAGIPISVLGLLYYTTVLIFAALNSMEVSITIPMTKNVRNTLYLLTAFGFGFSLYLMTLMQFIIKAWCLYCLFSAILSTSLFVVGQLLRIVSKKTVSQSAV